MSKKSKIALIAAIVLLIAGMALYPTIKRSFAGDKSESAVMPKEKSGGRNMSLSVTATVLEPQTLVDVFRMKGVLLPDEEVNLSFETSGKITNIYFKEGSYVNKGTLLAKVNDAPLQAELLKLKSQLPLAEDRLYRQQTLLEKDAVSQETYQSVKTQLETLKADIELVKSRIAQTELRAPFSGVIGLRQVSEGAYASPTVVLAKLTKISPLKVEFSLTESFVDKIQQGTDLTFTVTNDLTPYHAKVYAVESNLDSKTRTIFARARYENPGGKLKPGQSANVSIQLQQVSNTVVVPSISSIREMGRQIVYIYKDGKAKEVEIKTGLSTSSSIEVLSGLNLGDTLLTTGVMQLRDGMPVQISEFVQNISGQE